MSPGDFVIQDGAPERGIYKFIRMCNGFSPRFWGIPFGKEEMVRLKVRKCRPATEEEISRTIAKRITGNKNNKPDVL